MKEEIERIADITGICVLNLITMANILKKLGMEEDSKQITEMAVDVCGHGRGSYRHLMEREFPEKMN